MSGIVSAFGLGGANATAVVQTSRLTHARQRKDRNKDLAKTCLQLVTWVQAADAFPSVKHACVSQIVLGSKNSFVQVQWSSVSRHILNSLAGRGGKHPMIIQCDGHHHIESAHLNQISHDVFTRAPSKIVILSELSSDFEGLSMYPFLLSSQASTHDSTNCS